jgi:hypothetical protein
MHKVRIVIIVRTEVQRANVSYALAGNLMSAVSWAVVWEVEPMRLLRCWPEGAAEIRVAFMARTMRVVRKRVPTRAIQPNV